MEELSDFLDESLDADLRIKLETHMAACPNCWVVCDTTRRTIKVIREHECACALPADVQSRLIAAMERRTAQRANQT